MLAKAIAIESAIKVSADCILDGDIWNEKSLSRCHFAPNIHLPPNNLVEGVSL